ILTDFRIDKKMVGGMGVVYLLRHKETKSYVALKTMRGYDSPNSSRAADFIREIKCWVSLEEHSNIVRAYKVDIVKQKPVIWIEYVEGGDLSQDDRIGKLTIPETLDYAIQFCNGMNYAFRRAKLIHNDINPRNILISSDGTLKITDFGISRFTRPAVGQPEQDEGVQPSDAGTREYKAPETFQLATQQKYKYRSSKTGFSTCSDIFSFGVTFYEVLTGSLPFEDKEVFRKNPPTPASPRPEVPTAFSSLIMKCLEKDPANRYQSFQILMGELIEINNSLPTVGEECNIRRKRESKDAKNLYASGLEQFKSESWDDAKNYFGQVVDICPKVADDLKTRGFCYQAFNDNGNANKCFRKARNIEHIYKEALFYKGRCHLKLGQLDTAKNCFRELLAERKYDQKIAMAWYTEGLRYSELKNYDYAMDCFDQAVKICPGNAEYWYTKGTLHYGRKEWEEGSHCFSQANLNAPNHAPRIPRNVTKIATKAARDYHSEGIRCLELKKYGDAKRCFGRAVDIRPDKAEYWHDKGMCHYELQEYSYAKHCLAQILAISQENAENWHCKGRFYQELNKRLKKLHGGKGFHDYKRFFDREMAIRRKYAKALYYLGVCHMKLGELKEANYRLAEFVRIAPPKMAAEIKAAKRHIKQCNARQGNTRQGKARQGKARLSKAKIPPQATAGEWKLRGVGKFSKEEDELRDHIRAILKGKNMPRPFPQGDVPPVLLLYVPHARSWRDKDLSADEKRSLDSFIETWRTMKKA
ncbi:MAG: tetratricopeptide repeat protein, partial [Chloroflexi bacterium]|nr:tetratricopeptide repeat protein [Chloroflexota bacterium]